MTDDLDPGTTTRAALGEEIERLRLQLVERNDAVQFMTRMRDKAEQQRDVARRDLAAATTALTRIRDLHQSTPRPHHRSWTPICGHCSCGLVGNYDDGSFTHQVDWPCPTYGLAALTAAGDDPAATGGETDGQ